MLLRAAVERRVLASVENQFSQERRNRQYAAGPGKSRRKFWAKVEIAGGDHTGHANFVEGSRRYPKRSVGRKNLHSLRGVHGHHSATRENDLVDLMIVLSVNEAVGVFVPKRGDQRAANTDSVEFWVASLFRHILSN